MASFLLYLVMSFFSIIGGLIGFGLIYLLFSWIKTWRLKRKVPATREEMESGAKIPIGEKEVQDDKRRNFEKFREFEKLRRLGANGNRPPTGVSSVQGDSRVGERSSIPPHDNLSSAETDRSPREKVKLHRIDD